jgi:hypothetical protein
MANPFDSANDVDVDETTMGPLLCEALGIEISLNILELRLKEELQAINGSEATGFRTIKFDHFFRPVKNSREGIKIPYKVKNCVVLRPILKSLCISAAARLAREQGGEFSSRRRRIFSLVEAALQREIEHFAGQRSSEPKRSASAASEVQVDHKNEGIIHISQDGKLTIDMANPFFQAKQDDDKNAVSGQFLIYRRLFKKEKDCEYIAEYIDIKSNETGPGFEFRLWTKISWGNRPDLIQGVGFIVSDLLWLIGYHRRPVNRIRVVTANVLEWIESPRSCTAVFLGHTGAHSPTDKTHRTRIAIFKKRQPLPIPEDFNESIQFISRKLRFLTKQDLVKRKYLYVTK